jgi:cobalt-zinc-cadmium efflux system outer membrane protein
MGRFAARFVMLVALFCANGPGRAHALPVSFGDARALAERSAPLVFLAGKRVELARTQVDVAGTLANPTLTLQSASRTARLGTFVSVPLPLFGQRGKTVAAARADVDVSSEELSLAQSEARFFASVAWIELWTAQERARLLEVAAVDADRLLAIAQERFDAGSGPRVDVVRTRAGRARARADSASAQASVRSAALRLAPLLGPEQHSELSAQGVIDYPAELPQLRVLMERQAEHPALRRDRAQVSAADARIRAEERLRWPIVNAQLGANQFDRTLPGPPDFIGGLSFELPVLNQRGGTIARARSERVVFSSTQEANLRLLRAELEAAYREAQGAVAQLQALHSDVVPALLEARQMTEESYQSGRVDLIRLLDTQRALLESQIAEVSASAALGKALADLERAMGRPLDAGAGHAR